MLSTKRFLFFGVVIAMLFSSCKNKELEQANKELDKSSAILHDMCNERLRFLRNVANDHEKAKPLYEKGKLVDSILQKVIEQDKNSGQYIIQQYDSLAIHYCRKPNNIEKRITPQTAKNKLLQLEFNILDDLQKSMNICDFVIEMDSCKNGKIYGLSSYYLYKQ